MDKHALDGFGPNSGGLPSLEQLVESEHRFRQLVEFLPDAILVHTETEIVFVNPFCVQLMAATGPEQLLGLDISEIIHPDFLPEIRRRIQECYRTGTASLPSEAVLIAFDGSSVDIEAVAIPISWNGIPAMEVVARDIRQRKRAENEVHEWHERLDLAQQAGLRIGLWDWDISKGTVIWSDETYRQFGLTRSTFSGRVEEALKRIHPDDEPRVSRAIQKVLAGDAHYAAQYRILCPDGTTCWIDAHGVIVRDSNRMLGIGIDITNLKRAKQSLDDTEEKYLLLLNSTAEAIYGLDLYGTCTFCNPACLKLLGYQSTEDLLGKNMHNLIHHARVDGSAYPRDECPIHLSIGKGMERHITDEAYWRADGTSFLAEYWSYPMRKAGKVVGSVVSFLDISERRRAEQALRQSEAKYRELFENATYGIFRANTAGKFLDVNPALVAMLGYGSKQELMACNLSREVYENQDDRIEAIEKCRSAGRVDGVEVKWKHKNGKPIDVRLSGRIIQSGDVDTDDMEVIVDDVTLRRNLERQLRQAQKMEAVGLLAGGISHDFNNHLSVILGNTELLLENTESLRLREYAENIRCATNRATQLTRQLLAFSRKQVLRATALNLNEVVSDIGKILQRLIGEDVLVVLEPAANLGCVRADRGQIEQILMNLATNARDAMPNGGTFTVRTSNVNLGPEDVTLRPYVIPGKYVCLSATDTGEGMTAEVQSHMFEPFFTTKPKDRGTGLGLATVYGIVKQSSGYVWAASTLGAGCTFSVYLPLVNEEAVPFEPSAAVRCEHARGTETIMVLEDENALRQVTCEFLTANGYNVLQAGNGGIAIDLAESHKGSIALIISDVVLPDTNGPAVVAKLKAIHPEIKVLYVSGYVEAPLVQKLIQEHATLLQKPVTRAELLGKVDAILHDAMSRSASPNSGM
jgi:PAS domain S-box-containing protein